MSSNPFIRVGSAMKRYIAKIIYRDFGDVSYAKGLYNILKLYEKYVPQWERSRVVGKKRRLRRRWT